MPGSETVQGFSTQVEDTSLKQYLIDEFVEDYQKGRLTRREALKRLVGLTASLAAANSLLAACAPVATGEPSVRPSATNVAPATPSVVPPAPSASSALPTATAPAGQPSAGPSSTANPGGTTTSSLSVSPDDPAINASDIQLPGQGATLMAYLARPKGNGPFPAVLVCHENRGLTDHIKDVTRRVAKAGYIGLAVDLLSRQGGTAKVEASQVPGILGNTPPQQFVQDFQSALEYLKSQPYVAPGRFGMVGFCFGGGVTWRCATAMPELRAAVPYYGPNPPLQDVPKVQAAVLAIYGALDQRIDQGIPAIEQAMKENNKTFEKIIYPNANHAFNNDTGANYNPEAARDAWAKTLAWYEKYLKG